MRAVSNEWIYVVSRPSEGWPVCNGGDAELYKHWIQCRAEALKDLLNQVRTGTITLVEADCEVWHETCKRFLAKFSVAYDRQPSTR